MKLTSIWHNNCVVLLYHRIIKLDFDPQLLCVTPKNFEDHLKHIKEHYYPISLRTLCLRMQENRIPNRSIVITFDDGYFDNFYYAFPVLKKYNIPATFFITTGMIDSDRETWWDDLERIFLLNHRLPQDITIEIKGAKYNWILDSYRKRETVYNELHPLLKPLNHKDRDKIIRQLLSWAGLPLTGRETHRFLSTEELTKLGDGSFIEIGSHTVSHSCLAKLSTEEKSFEIEESKKKLESILGHGITSFSYPFGIPGHDFTDETSKFIKKAKYLNGLANSQMNVDRNTDLYNLPRRLVRNWDMNVFANKLSKFFEECPSVQ